MLTLCWHQKQTQLYRLNFFSLCSSNLFQDQVSSIPAGRSIQDSRVARCEVVVAILSARPGNASPVKGSGRTGDTGRHFSFWRTHVYSENEWKWHGILPVISIFPWRSWSQSPIMIHDVAWHTMTLESSGKICARTTSPSGRTRKNGGCWENPLDRSGGCLHMLWERRPWESWILLPGIDDTWSWKRLEEYREKKFNLYSWVCFWCQQSVSMTSQYILILYTYIVIAGLCIGNPNMV